MLEWLDNSGIGAVVSELFGGEFVQLFFVLAGEMYAKPNEGLIGRWADMPHVASCGEHC